MGSTARAERARKRCPTCRHVLEKERPAAFPFCSERCRLIDLGRWLDEDYRIPEDEEN